MKRMAALLAAMGALSVTTPAVAAASVADADTSSVCSVALLIRLC